VQYQCPACQRQFGEPGFCPFDRGKLALIVPAGPSDKQTILSVAMPAVEPTDSAQHKTQMAPRRETFPLTPSTVGTPQSQSAQTAVPYAVPTQEITSARARALPSDSQQPKVRSVSAVSDSAADALEAYKTTRENEYDKLVGQTLDGRYYVEKKIGEGGMGVVFAARHAVIERPLAIKVLKREVMRDTATIRRFVQEAKAASRIGHPNIVDVTDFGTTPDGMTYSVMEYIEGQTLGSAIRHAAPFPPLRAVKIAAQIARALGAAHDKGITHRDLKPENVFLLDRDGRTDFVKIVDFGIAKVAPTPGSAAEPRLTRAGSVFGTPEYMAPEQAAGRGDTDGRVDVYALGVILYEMVCARVPHRGDSMVRTLAMQMLDPVEPPSKVRPDLNIPAELELVIMTALAKKRENRYQTMGQLHEALEKVHTVIGQSITGSPVYALATLAAFPPGADPKFGPASPGHSNPGLPAVATGTARTADERTGPRSHSPTGRRLKNEPEFTASDKPPTFEHMLDDVEAPKSRSAWPLILMMVLILGSAGAVIAVMMKSKRSATEHADASVAFVPPPVIDAGVAPPPTPAPDAAVIAIIPVDAAEELVVSDAGVDAADDIVIVRTDAGVRSRRDAGYGTVIPDTPNRRGTILVQVLTKPEGATLYAGNTYRGPGGTQLEEPLGSKLEIRCHQQGYKDGKVQLVFDGKTEVVLCVLQRIKICINNIKNPFDDCELDPSKPIPPQ
jgi:serine/threonine protein kinase